jgi:hypothetical protein
MKYAKLYKTMVYNYVITMCVIIFNKSNYFFNMFIINITYVIYLLLLFVIISPLSF